MKTKVSGVFLATLLAACSGGEKTTGAASASSDASADHWCQAQPGNTREQLVALMGPPTSEPPNQMGWTVGHYAYTAFLDADGTAKQLDIQTSSLSDEEKAALKCKVTRTRREKELAAAAAAKTPHSSTPACELVTAAEMSAILGAPVTGEAVDHRDVSTECIYKPLSGSMPSVEFTVTWGDGYAAMAGMGLARSREHGLVTPYDGIGDQAGSAGPLLMIRTGEDLVTLVFNGVSDSPAAARRIFDTAKPRM
jgi:hypothetical protein